MLRNSLVVQTKKKYLQPISTGKVYLKQDPIKTSLVVQCIRGFPGGSDGKESACNAGCLGSIPGWGDPLEKEMTTHSSILAWEIPWIEDPGGL